MKKESVKNLLKDRMLRRAIEVHKNVVNGGNLKDLEQYGYDPEVPIDKIKQHNEFEIIMTLGFNHEDSVNPVSNPKKVLDKLVKEESNVESIIEQLVEYRDQTVKSE